MTLAAEESEGFLPLHRRAVEQAQHTAHLFVELLRGVLSLKNSLFVGFGHVIAVVGIGLAHRQTVGPGAELEVESVFHGFVGIVTAAPVADDHTVEGPVALQNLVQEDVIMTIVLVLI